jgi:hypothetical protein
LLSVKYLAVSAAVGEEGKRAAVGERERTFASEEVSNNLNATLQLNLGPNVLPP